VGHIGNTNLCGYTIYGASPAGVVGSIGVDETQYTKYVSSSSSTDYAGSVTVSYTVPSTQSGKAFVAIIGACGNDGYCTGLSTGPGCSGITLVNSTATEGASGGGIAEAICYQSAGSYTAILTYSNPGSPFTTFGSLGVYVFEQTTT